MPRNGSGVLSAPAGTTATTGTTIESAKYNAFVADIIADGNAARPIVAGGTGATSAAGALLAFGLTATAAEINVLDGITATAAELNTLDGITTAGAALLNDADAAAQLVTLGLTATALELNTLDGITATAAELNLMDGLATRQTTITDSDTAFPTSGAVVDYVPVALNAGGAAPLYACRAWVNFNGTGTVAIRASGNVSSVTDNGPGDYTINFTIAMPTADYASTINAQRNTSSGNDDILGSLKEGLSVTQTASAMRIVINDSAGNNLDPLVCTVAVFC